MSKQREKKPAHTGSIGKRLRGMFYRVAAWNSTGGEAGTGETCQSRETSGKKAAVRQTWNKSESFFRCEGRVFSLEFTPVLQL